MQNYFVTFEPDVDPNSDFSIAFRGKLEDLAPRNWFHVFPFQIAIRTDLTIDEISKELAGFSPKKRFTIVEAKNWFYSSSSRSFQMKEFGF